MLSIPVEHVHLFVVEHDDENKDIKLSTRTCDMALIYGAVSIELLAATVQIESLNERAIGRDDIHCVAAVEIGALESGH